MRFCLVVLCVLGCESSSTGGGVGLTDADCQQADSCGTAGWCTAKDGDCIAGKDSDCWQSRFCKKYGACTAKGGECVI